MIATRCPFTRGDDSSLDAIASPSQVHSSRLATTHVNSSILLIAHNCFLLGSQRPPLYVIINSSTLYRHEWPQSGASRLSGRRPSATRTLLHPHKPLRDPPTWRKAAMLNCSLQRHWQYRRHGLHGHHWPLGGVSEAARFGAAAQTLRGQIAFQLCVQGLACKHHNDSQVALSVSGVE